MALADSNEVLIDTVMPVYVLTRIGVDRQDDHRDDGRVQVEPSCGSSIWVNGTMTAIAAREGIARPTLARLTASAWPRRVCPMYRPSGRATAAAMRTDTREIPDVLEEAVRNAVLAAPVGWVREPGRDLRDQVHCGFTRAHGVRRRCSRPSRTSTLMASAIDPMAPTRILGWRTSAARR